MKIERKDKPRLVPFAELVVGALFVYGNVPYFKIKASSEYQKTWDNAVSMETGLTYTFQDTHEVTPVAATLTVTNQ